MAFVLPGRGLLLRMNQGFGTVSVSLSVSLLIGLAERAAEPYAVASVPAENGIPS